MDGDKIFLALIGIMGLIGIIAYIKFMYEHWKEKYKRKQLQIMYDDIVYRSKKSRKKPTKLK
jgi:hypothetical protein